MNKMFLKKILLSVLIVSIVSFGLTGCSDHVSVDNKSAVTIHLSSTYPDHHYNIYVDSDIIVEDVTVGVRSLGRFLLGQRVFKVNHHKGASFGSASQSVSISNPETDVYFDVTF
jgi:hypothetical protein